MSDQHKDMGAASGLWDEWKRTPGEENVDYISRLLDVLEEQSRTIAALSMALSWIVGASSVSHLSPPIVRPHNEMLAEINAKAREALQALQEQGQEQAEEGL